jgi:hypothetical protein
MERKPNKTISRIDNHGVQCFISILEILENTEHSDDPMILDNNGFSFISL